MKRTMITFLGLLGMLSCSPTALAQSDTLRILFWNLENFFSPHTGTSTKTLSRARFAAKCNGIAKTILYASEDIGGIPDLIGFAEVENGDVLEAMISRTSLRKLEYAIVHYDSPDPRGIDCALLYRKSTMKLSGSSPIHVRDSNGTLIPTRDILLARFGNMAILVNHHPSQIGGKQERRQAAMAAMHRAADSLLSAGLKGVVAVGDFNECLWPSEGKGTIKHSGKWEKIDGHFCFGEAETVEKVLDYPFLLTKDSAYGGRKPLRTFSGPRYLGGISDHLPIVVTLFF